MKKIILLFLLFLNSIVYSQDSPANFTGGPVNIPNDTKYNPDIFYQTYFKNQLDTLILGEWISKARIIENSNPSTIQNQIYDSIRSNNITFFRDSIVTPKYERFYTKTNSNYFIQNEMIKTFLRKKKNIQILDSLDIEICTPTTLILSKNDGISFIHEYNFIKLTQIYVRSDIDTNEINKLTRIWYSDNALFSDSIIHLSKNKNEHNSIEIEINNRYEFTYSLLNSKPITDKVLDGVYFGPRKMSIDTDKNILYFFKNKTCNTYKYEFIDNENIKLTKL